MFIIRVLIATITNLAAATQVSRERFSREGSFRSTPKHFSTADWRGNKSITYPCSFDQPELTSFISVAENPGQTRLSEPPGTLSEHTPPAGRLLLCIRLILSRRICRFLYAPVEHAATRGEVNIPAGRKDPSAGSARLREAL